jgi:exonuclease III
MNSVNKDNIRIATLNVGGLICNIPYIEQCLNNTDILVIQEHWLYPDSISIIQTLHQNFTGWGRCCSNLDLNSLWRRGKGGVAIFWRKSLNASIEILDEIGNDRIVAINFKTSDKHNFYIIGVYFPSSNLPLPVYIKKLLKP